MELRLLDARRCRARFTEFLRQQTRVYRSERYADLVDHAQEPGALIHFIEAHIDGKRVGGIRLQAGGRQRRLPSEQHLGPHGTRFGAAVRGCAGGGRYAELCGTWLEPTERSSGAAWVIALAGFAAAGSLGFKAIGGSAPTGGLVRLYEACGCRFEEGVLPDVPKRGLRTQWMANRVADVFDRQPNTRAVLAMMAADFRMRGAFTANVDQLRRDLKSEDRRR